MSLANAVATDNYLFPWHGAMEWGDEPIGLDVHTEAVVIAALNDRGQLSMEGIVETEASRIPELN